MNKVFLFIVFTSIVGYLEMESINGILTGFAAGCGFYFVHEFFGFDFLDGKI